jgi:pimeloyl-CoA dehydrogenase large subunit
MDLRFSPQETAFRAEVRAFIDKALNPATKQKLTDGRSLAKADMVEWVRALNAKGWSVPHWPKEWGGLGWSQVQLYIFNEEIMQAPAPQPLPFGHSMVGPVLIQFGSTAHKHQYLPAIRNLDTWWCQGFSEPGSGSDLASLKTTAVRDGNHYVINGQKTWTTLAQHADMMFCLARTDMTAKKQAGISFILLDMKSKGVTVRPIITIDGGRDVNEVFFDDVRVPVENLVGDENKGWDYAKFLLGNERVGIARIGITKQRIRRIKELASLVADGDGSMMTNPRFRERVAAVEIELKALEMTQLRVLAAETNKGSGRPDPASSILKIKGSELQQATTELLLDIVGPYALPFGVDDEPGSNEMPVAPNFAGPAAPMYFNYRKVSIYGGTNEIQKNIIAKAVLGL